MTASTKQATSYPRHMNLVLNSANQRTLDQLSIDEFGIPAFTLMENAGRGAASIIIERFGPLEERRVVIACGKGNNGGDGLVLARILYTQGACVQVISLGEPSSPESILNLHLLTKLQANDAETRLTITEWPQCHDGLPTADLYVDALLGTGLTRPLRGSAAQIVDRLNSVNTPVVALDIPTGLNADTGLPMGSVLRASLTITMGALKPGLLLEDGPQYAGDVRVVDIGIPRFLIHDETIRERNWHTTDRGIAALLPKRSPKAHKYSAGMVLVVGGAPGLTGAPVMAAMAAARVGAGYVACATPEQVQPILADKLTEIPAIGLPEDPRGGIDIAAALCVLEPWIDKAHALLIGPGLGRLPQTQTFVRQLLKSTILPAVIDADGLYALSPDQIADESEGRWILTPHWGEFQRLVPDPVHVQLIDRLHLAHEWARTWGSPLILKGLPSVVCAPGHDALICSTGSNALATAGTGDILAGLCAGLLAQGSRPVDAATCALHIGGAAADRYTSRHPEVTMMATDMLNELPGVLRERFLQ